MYCLVGNAGIGLVVDTHLRESDVDERGVRRCVLVVQGQLQRSNLGGKRSVEGSLERDVDSVGVQDDE